MKSILSWFVLIVSIAVIVSSCSEKEESTTIATAIPITSSDDSSDNSTSTSDNSTSTSDNSSSSLGVFVGVGISGNIVRSTDNGSTWDNVTSPTGNDLYGVTFANNTFVGVGVSGNIVRSTDNGTTWDNVTSPTGNHLRGVGFGNNTFVGVGFSGNIVRSTDNGSSWDNVTSGLAANGNYNLYGVTF